MTPFPPEQVKQIKALVASSLPDFPTHAEVEQIAQTVFEKHRDKAAYALERHEHSLADIQGIETLRSGLAPLAHRHTADEIEGLQEQIDEARAFVEDQIPTDYAPQKHRHSLDQVDGKLPFARLEGGAKILLALQKLETLERHDHPDIREAVNALGELIADLPPPKAFDPTPLKVEINELRGLLLAMQKPQPRPVEVAINPIPAPQVVCDAEYLIVASDPRGASVQDAKGRTGETKVTEREGRFLVRPLFDFEPAQPLTFTFPSAPVLCSIGCTTDSSKS